MLQNPFLELQKPFDNHYMRNGEGESERTGSLGQLHVVCAVWWTYRILHPWHGDPTQ